MARRLMTIASVMLLGTGLLACGLEDDGLPHFPNGNNNSNNNTNNNQPPDKTTDKLQPPTVGALPNTVCSDTVPVQGTSVPGSTVLITGGSQDISTDPNLVSGAYCADVPLVKGKLNTLQVYAHDPKLGVSKAVVVKVTHNKCNDDIKNPDQPAPKSKNVALGVKATASETASQGNETFLTDGDSSTTAVYGGGWGWMGTEIWVMLKLDKLAEVEKVVVKWRDKNGDSTHYFGKAYKVLVATGSGIGDPDLKNGYWTQLSDVTAGDGGLDTFDYSSTKPLAQYVALWMEWDGSSASWGETFAISEIEVWEAPRKTTTTPPPSSNTCSSIGS